MRIAPSQKDGKNDTKQDLLSICITVLNRSKVCIGNQDYAYLLPNCLKSVAQAIRSLEHLAIEVIISDYQSTDWPLEEWIDSILAGIDYRVIQCTEDFSRGSGRNVAAEHANGNWLFFLDADMYINKGILEKGIHYLKSGFIYFPQCFYYINKEETMGFWSTGRGNVFIDNATFLKLGRWPCPPTIDASENEDIHFYFQVFNQHPKIMLRHESFFYHQYHPGKSVDDAISSNVAMFAHVTSESKIRFKVK